MSISPDPVHKCRQGSKRPIRLHLRGPMLGDHIDVPSPPDPLPVQPVEFPDDALDAVSDDRAPDFPGNGHTQPGPFHDAGTERDDEVSIRNTFSAPQGDEIGPIEKLVRFFQSESGHVLPPDIIRPGRVALDQTVNRLRPFARRRLRIRRPCLVDIRFKNPCFLARLTLLGWYVRFISHP